MLKDTFSTEQLQTIASVGYAEDFLEISTWHSGQKNFLEFISKVSPLGPFDCKCIFNSFVYFTILQRNVEYLLQNCLFYVHRTRSSRSKMFFKIGLLKNFKNFPGKHLCWSLLFSKKRLKHRCFSAKL